MKLQEHKIGKTNGEKAASRTSPRSVKTTNERVSYGGGEGSAIKSKDFSAVENSRQAVAIIRSIAASAGKSAASEAKALHMPKVYANKAKVIGETVDGKKTVIATADNIPGKKFYSKYTSGTIMYAIEK